MPARPSVTEGVYRAGDTLQAAQLSLEHRSPAGPPGRPHEDEVGGDRALEHVRASVQPAHLTRPGCRRRGCHPRAEPPDQGSLGDELDLELAGEVLAGETRCCPLCTNRAPGRCALCRAGVRAPTRPAVVGDDPQVPDPRRHQGIDQFLRDAAQPEPAHCTDVPSPTSATASAVLAMTLSTLDLLLGRPVGQPASLRRTEAA